MPALPADIARFTTDGVVLSTDLVAGQAVLDAHPNARRTSEGQEIEMFFVNAADAQTVLDERFELLSLGGPLHDGIEVEESLQIGTVIPVQPSVPCWQVTDADARTINVRTRGYARKMSIDRYAIEVLQ